MRWQRELEEALNYKSAVILCGNIKDKYLYKIPHTEDEYKLLSLKDFLLTFLGRRFKMVKFYDPIRKITDHCQAQDLQTQKEEGQKGRDVADDLSGTTPKRTAPTESTVDRDMVRIKNELALQEDQCFVLQYSDKITPDKAHSPDEMRLILHLEKMIENIHPTNRLILLFFFNDQVPRELYQNNPKTTLIEIPPPDRADLKTLFKRYYKRNDEETEHAVNISDGLKFLEIEQIVSSLKDGFDIRSFDERVRLYKFGEERNYWKELNLKKLDNALNYFTKEKGIKGQNDAIMKVVEVITTARADIQRKTGGNYRAPRGVLFFAGPTGVGKTLAAKTLAEFLFGSEDALLRFDMSEYRLEHQVTRLYGAPPSYVGFESGGVLTNAIREKPFSVVLFDEMEKAHPRVLDIFLQILEDGRLTDSKGETVFFSETIIVFTSNIGTRSTNTKGEYIPEIECNALEKLKAKNDKEGIRQHFLTCLENFFKHELSRPELLERIGIDNLVVFKYIDTEDTIKGIFHHSLAQLQRVFNESYKNSIPKLELVMNINKVVECLYNQYRNRIKEFGARSIKNIINEEIRKKLALQILQVEYNNRPSGIINMGVEDDQLRVELQ